MTNKKNNAKLVLEDGSVHLGRSFGYFGNSAGETVFSTAMNGYPEGLTDPSHRGQILVYTYPLIGNYGVPRDISEDGLKKFWESDNIHISGLIVSEYSNIYSHWNADKSLSEWLIENKIPAITGIDTRALTKRIRDHGCMNGKILVDGDIDWLDPNKQNLVEQVSVKQKSIYGNGQKKIILVDCGTKNNIIRCFLKRDTTIVRVPYNYDYTNEEYDGLFISNGPGDPKMNTQTIELLKKAIDGGKPIMGICLGSQLLALAAGADTYKMSYGHRGHNQSVLLKGTNRCFITSQNHGFAVDTSTLPSDWEVFFENANDGTCEGIKHKTKPIFAVQFHPEASGGPNDTEFLFDEFLTMVENSKKQ